MSKDISLRDLLLRSPQAAIAIYAAFVALFSFAAWTSIANVMWQQSTVAASVEILARLEGRDSARNAKANSNASAEASNQSPCLEGATQTVAGATLLQRVGAAITRVGGNTLSSQVELQERQSKTGFISVIASCEVDQPGLQKLLYDLEAGTPFLFVDQLVVQSPVSAANSPAGKLRLLIRVSGRWRGTT
jgi:general secretion pathway protein M